MKKIKTINKLLSSLTLLSPLSGIGFNNQYENTQKVITENSNNSLNNHIASQTNAQREMGGITVNVEGTRITGYVSGTGDLVVDSDITEIAASAFQSNSNINGLDLSNATRLTTIENHAFYSCSSLTGDLVIPSSVTSIENYAFTYTRFTSLDLSQATNLTTIGEWCFTYCSSLTGNLVIPSSLTSIGETAFAETNITSLDFSNAINLTVINSSFCFCSNLTGDLKLPLSIKEISPIAGTEGGAFGSTKITSVNLYELTNLTIIGSYSFASNSKLTGEVIIPSSVTEIRSNAFNSTNITSLDLSNATSLTTIRIGVFEGCTNLSGDLVIPSSVTSIAARAFSGVTLDNLYFSSKTPPKFENKWKPTITGKVYVPSEAAKEAYLKEDNFGFDADQIDLWTPPESKSNTGLVLGLVFGLGIPIILAAGFGIWYFTKKKKTTVKI